MGVLARGGALPFSGLVSYRSPTPLEKTWTFVMVDDKVLIHAGKAGAAGSDDELLAKGGTLLRAIVAGALSWDAAVAKAERRPVRAGLYAELAGEKKSTRQVCAPSLSLPA